MGVNKVIYDDSTLIDLTEDTVTPEDLVSGVTAHNASGDLIKGTLSIKDPMLAYLQDPVSVDVDNDTDTITATMPSGTITTVITSEGDVDTITSTIVPDTGDVNYIRTTTITSNGAIDEIRTTLVEISKD